MQYEDEAYYSIALTRLTGFNQQTALLLYKALGSSRAVYEHRNDIGDSLKDCSPNLLERIRHWSEALQRATVEMEFVHRHGVRVLTLNDADYPRRLAECPDAPLVLYYKGSADLNQRYIVDMVGTRRCTRYGQDLVTQFLRRLSELCPQVLVVSGLAYGIDICAHRQALSVGYETVGVLAHGLDTIYPNIHRATAVEMLSSGGLLTEYMTQTEPMPNNFRQRNRIVAGMSDATIVVESARKGGALITARIAQDYGRDVLAFPGNVGQPYSEGCNNLIRDCRAGLITSADDFVEAVGWRTEKTGTNNAGDAIQRQLFPDLEPDEKLIVEQLLNINDLQVNMLSVKTNLSLNRLNALLFQLEMKGIVRALAGGTYHLLG